MAAPTPLITDWIGSIATGLGSLATAGALWFTYRLFKLEKNEREDEERSQARLVSAWITGPHGQADHGKVVARLHVRNLSDEPITAVLIEGLYEAERDRLGKYRLLEERLDAFELLPPHHDETYQHFVRPPEDLAGDDAIPSVRIEFTDARGLRWTRWPDNTLERVLDEE